MIFIKAVKQTALVHNFVYHIFWSNKTIQYHTSSWVLAQHMNFVWFQTGIPNLIFQTSEFLSPLNPAKYHYHTLCEQFAFHDIAQTSDSSSGTQLRKQTDDNLLSWCWTISWRQHPITLATCYCIIILLSDRRRKDKVLELNLNYEICP